MIYANLEGQNFVGKIDSAKIVHPGDHMNLVFQLRHAHFFGKKSELRIN